MTKIIFIITIFCHSAKWVAPFDVPILTEMQDVIGLAHDIGDILSGNLPLQNLFVSQSDPMGKVMKKLDEITEQIENLDVKLDDLLASIISRIPLEDNINADIRDLQQYISRIDDIYDHFLAYSQDISNFNNETLKEFVSIVTSANSNNIPDIIKKIFNIIVPKKSALNRVGFLENMSQKRKMMTPLEMCNPQISYQHRLLQIYNLISLTETRAFLMTAYAYRLQSEFQKVKSVGESNRARNGFIMRLDQYLIKFKKNMLAASREIFLCDPESLTDTDNYVEFDGLFHGYVMNEYEVTMNPCSTTCPEIWTWTHHRCYNLYDENYCPPHPCKGLIHNCKWIGGDVDICEFSRDSLKRYNYVRSYSNGWYGKWSPCEGNVTYHELHSRRWHFLSCDMCFCSCEESFGTSRAIRTFSLRPQVSNIDKNKVVSDVKFTLKDKMIHIQIEEAPLLPLGHLARNESSLVPLEDFIYLSNLTEGGWVQVKDGQYIPMTRDTDFAFIRRDQKVLNLDEISGGPNYVLTGVKLGHESEKYTDDELAGNVSPLQLEIQVTPFNYANGKLMPTEENPSMWLTPSTQPQIPSAYAKDRQLIEIGDKSYRWESGVSSPNLKPNQNIEFQQSDIWSDAGQTTLPLIDSRPAATSSPIAFDGLGLAYRGHEKFGGFVILKAMTIDVSNYMDASMTDKQRSYYTKTSRQSLPNPPPKKQIKYYASKNDNDDL